MEPLRCLSCGSPAVGVYYDLYLHARAILAKTEDIADSKKFFVHNDDNLIPIFESLNIHKFCCRSQLTSALQARALII